ncbi:MAG: sodium:calcium antiporter, partial [Nanoarchaeota archaeon]|nr:sodium:calcium antiporter [Nanoarchaeota archaeon]
MIVNIIILFISFFILVKSSDYFVKSSSSIAKSLGVSELVIGLTLVAIGTSIPELASSIVAALNGSGSIVIGNVVGSNIANIALIIGLSAIVSTIPKNKGIVVKDGYIMLFITALILLTLYDLKLTMVEGIILFILYLSYLMFLLEKKDNKEDEEKSSNFKSYINYVFLFIICFI